MLEGTSGSENASIDAEPVAIEAQGVGAPGEPEHDEPRRERAGELADDRADHAHAEAEDEHHGRVGSDGRRGDRHEPIGARAACASAAGPEPDTRSRSTQIQTIATRVIHGSTPGASRTWVSGLANARAIAAKTV